MPANISFDVFVQYNLPKLTKWFHEKQCQNSQEIIYIFVVVFLSKLSRITYLDWFKKSWEFINHVCAFIICTLWWLRYFVKIQFFCRIHPRSFLLIGRDKSSKIQNIQLLFHYQSHKTVLPQQQKKKKNFNLIKLGKKCCFCCGKTVYLLSGFDKVYIVGE